MADVPDLDPTWAQEYREEWEPAYSATFEELATTPVRVLSFGPNPSGAHGDKRRELAAHMSSLREVHVAFPEDVQAADPRFAEAAGNTLLQEELMIEAVDLVVGYQADTHEAPGLQAEVTKFEDYPHVMAKMRFFVPRGYERKSGVASEALRRVSKEKKFPYTRPQMEDCENMRAQCERWIEEARSRKFWDRWRQGRPSVPAIR